jgi:hypothetical protein
MQVLNMKLTNVVHSQCKQYYSLFQQFINQNEEKALWGAFSAIKLKPETGRPDGPL